ncbi:hypothetical protein FB446DRAFT_655870 [Lentinula raphanica]|nr:hypothetical protein FB446DRAFT_655870 [Lentinula raphanica]
MRPRIRAEKRKSLAETQASASTPDYSFVPVTSPKRKRTLAALPTFYLANGKKFTQKTRLPIPLGQVGLQERHSELLTATTSRHSTEGGGEVQVSAVPEAPTPHSRKRLAQFRRWVTEVIPKTIKPYMALLRETENLKNDPMPIARNCACKNRTIELSVVIVRFRKLEKVSLSVCPCRPAALQLMEQGLFPCAPLQPSLAVEMPVLDFVARLFVRISPNTTALADCIQDFLGSQGYNMKGEDPLRRWFGNALQWYNSLRDATRQFVDTTLAVTRSWLPQCDEVSKDFPEVGSQGVEKRENEDHEDHEDVEDDKRDGHRAVSDDDNEVPVLSRPSEYLRARCPLCFGGNCTISDGLDVIVCIDACFTQKHNKQRNRDPPRLYPRTVFVPESTVKTWENLVDQVRPSKSRNSKGKESTVEQQDSCEGTLKVPNSVLDACEQSFAAADETREKASSQFFDSTALMGLLCRHDRVLWLVNMTSPGERQHYAFTLIELLFKHLPRTWTVGVLYDIGCQIHRSCVHWGFLNDYLDRISFAISVFHAYGHGWACQCVYHPRKCEGFGLSDGEGCERFWHSISKLIAYLRVCGHHLRLYTLDSQVEHSANEGLMNMGKWLARKWLNAEAKYREADEEVKGSNHQVGFLREQWKSQVIAQTRPLPRQSRQAGRKAVETALRLKNIRKNILISRTLVDRISKLEDIISDVDAEDYDIADAEAQLPVLQKRLSDSRLALLHEEQKLGVEDKASYQHLARSPFINLRMNARAIKMRLRSRLTARKFERDRLERSFRRQQHNDRKVHMHTEDSVKKRDPSIQKLARHYNSLCTEMQRLIDLKRAPHNVTSPKLIPMKDLFNLDVDDNIWQDVGLDETSDGQNPPLWLCDENVRRGIRSILLRDRCDEEFLRLKHEMRSLQQWMREEWQVVTDIKFSFVHFLDILHQLHNRRVYLGQLLLVWKKDLRKIPYSMANDNWGPSASDLVMIQDLLETQTDITKDADEAGVYESSDEFSVFDDDDLDVGLLECMDTLELADAAGSVLDDDDTEY